MSKPSFVGFQEKITIPEGFEQLLIEEELASEKDRDQLFSLLSEPRFVSQWLGEVESFDSRAGGKLKFHNSAGASVEATCTGLVLGKEISLISDQYGNFTAKVVKSKSHNSIKVSFAVLTDKVEEKREEIAALIIRLRALL